MLLIKAAYFILCALCLLLIGRGLAYGLRKSSLNLQAQKRFKTWFYLLLTGWVALISVLALSGFLGDFESMPPRVMLVLLPPMIGILIYSIRSKQLKSILKAIPIHWLL